MEQYTPKEIAKICGVSTRAIYKTADRLGIFKRGGRWVFSSDDAEKLFAHYSVSRKTNQTEPETEPLEPENEPLAENEPENELTEQNEPTKRNFANQTELENEQNELETEQTEPSEAISALVETIALLQEQLKIKDKQIEDLTRDKEHYRKESERLLANVSLLNVADKKEALLIEQTSQDGQQNVKKKGFWARLFG